MRDYFRSQILGDVNEAPDVRPEESAEVKVELPVFPKAPLGKRTIAVLIDLAVAWGPVGMIYLLTNLKPALAIKVFLWVPALLWGLVYFLVKDGWPGGQSVGKRLLGLMVVTLYDKKPCTRWRSAVRQFAIIVVSFIPYIGSLVEPVLVLADRNGRRLGDQMAKTQVIEIAVYNLVR